ncbi:MAG: DUF5671 domain-containing protein [Candidatus Buchananbacteria bacterium]
MENVTKTTPKDVFLHSLIIITLYISVFAFIALIFQYVNYSFPDQLQYSLINVFDTIRQTIASIIIAWPLFIFLTWLIHREINQEPAKREIKIGKWLTYLTLLISAVAMIIQLIRLVYNFLGGELTLGFSLKLLTILVVAAGVFGYYLWDLRRNFTVTKKKVKIIAWITSAIVLVTIIAGFFIVGSPTTQRARRFDEQRVNDLQNIKSEIINYWQKKQVLPTKLDTLTDTVSGFTAPTDPATKAAYEYTTSGNLTFELCATFQQASLDQNNTTIRYIGIYNEPANAWKHNTGRKCFPVTIDPELYKLVPEKAAAVPIK